MGDVGSSTSSPSIRAVTTPSRACALCNSEAKYACPRCRAPTCSLLCSRKHKSDTGCSGERNKAEYVPMNTYGWGTMMRDYSFLEEVGRKVGEWGDEIARGAYQAELSKTKKGKNGEKATRGGRRRAVVRSTKRHILQSYLESLEIGIDLLPNGMERRASSQSTWDPKLKQPLLTIEFTFYPPAHVPLPAEVSHDRNPHTILTHRNQISKTLLETLQSQIPRQPSHSRRHRENLLPGWVPPLVHPHPDDPEGFVLPDCYMHATLDFPYQSNSPITYYHKLDPASPLSQLLRHAHFVEFPTIHVFDRDASSFQGTVVDKSGRVAQDDATNERAPKCKKMHPEAIAGLLGGYRSSSGSDDDQAHGKDSLLMLEGYSEEEDDSHGMCEGEKDHEELSFSDTDETLIKPEKLLELIKQAREAADEDILDWGDEWQDDTEP
ncbi:hypothetical protein J3A83DRAFT_2040629 [Scleroderma citrinum]